MSGRDAADVLEGRGYREGRVGVEQVHGGCVYLGQVLGWGIDSWSGLRERLDSTFTEYQRAHIGTVSMANMFEPTPVRDVRSIPAM